MKPSRILLPIDIARCPVEAFALVNGMARHQAMALTLLYVVELNIQVPDNRIYEELGRGAASSLERLERNLLPACSNVRIRIRTGRPAEEILAEARAEQFALIILAEGRRSLFRQLMVRGLGWTIEKVIRRAPCSVLITSQREAAPFLWRTRQLRSGERSVAFKEGLSHWLLACMMGLQKEHDGARTTQP